jgi:two-component system, OmpR family, response regulator CpxR
MTTSTTPPKRPIILCIDDDDVALRVRKLLLGTAGYDVLAASSGEAGLATFRENPVDVVLADHFLSDKVGTEIAKEMKQLKPQVPILIVSGTAEEPSGLEFVDGFLPKSESPKVLLDALARLLKD